MTMPTEKPLGLAVRSSNENRRTSKPLMEKRRRARINQSLSELKSLILDAVKKDNQHTRHSKLEKADILEMTVRHLQNLHRQRIVHADPLAINKFRAGYSECAREVSRFVGRMEGTDPVLCTRIMNHISFCLSSLGETEAASERISASSPMSGNGCPASPQRPSSNESCSSGSFMSSPSHSQVRVDIPSSSSSPTPSEGLIHFQSSSSPRIATTEPCRILVPENFASRHPTQGYFLTPNPGSNAVPVITSQLPNSQLTLIVPASSAFAPMDLQPSSPLNLVTGNREVDTVRPSSSDSLSRNSPSETHHRAFAKEYLSDSEASSEGSLSSPVRPLVQGADAKFEKIAEQQGENVWRPW